MSIGATASKSVREKLYVEAEHRRRLACTGSAGVSQLRPRVEFFLHKCLCDLRISEMFEIILDADESEPALSDLHVCGG